MTAADAEARGALSQSYSAPVAPSVWSAAQRDATAPPTAIPTEASAQAGGSNVTSQGQAQSSQPPGAAGQPPAVAPFAELRNTPGGRLLASVRHRGDLSAGERMLADTSDESFLHWISWGVTARKARHQIDVYYKGRLFRSYHAVFGRNPDHGAKLFEGDFRTPEGVYWIVKKHDSSRWRRFLGLNYPNYVDRSRFLEKIQAGEVPLEDGEQPSPGGQIGIHGTDEPRFNHWNINWTAGCISVDNDAVLELDRILPVGTIVIIKP